MQINHFQILITSLSFITLFILMQKICTMNLPDLSLTIFNFFIKYFDISHKLFYRFYVYSSVVKRLSRILDMDESAVQLCSGLPVFP